MNIVDVSESFKIDADSHDEVAETRKSKANEIRPATFKALFDSDGDMSDEERKYLERRKRNTEYMELMEKERELKGLPKLATVCLLIMCLKKLNLLLQREITSATLLKEFAIDNYVAKEHERDLLEVKEAERKALLLADRNPEPPEKTPGKEDKPLNEVRTLNGSLEKPERLSESSDGGSSTPKSQVYSILLITCVHFCSFRLQLSILTACLHQ